MRGWECPKESESESKESVLQSKILHFVRKWIQGDRGLTRDGTEEGNACRTGTYLRPNGFCDRDDIMIFRHVTDVRVDAG